MPAVEEYFERRVLDLAAAAGRSYVVWQDVLDNRVKIQSDAIVHVWKWWWPVAKTSTERSFSGTIRSFVDRCGTRYDVPQRDAFSVIAVFGEPAEIKCRRKSIWIDAFPAIAGFGRMTQKEQQPACHLTELY